MRYIVGAVWIMLIFVSKEIKMSNSLLFPEFRAYFSYKMTPTPRGPLLTLSETQKTYNLKAKMNVDTLVSMYLQS